MWPSLFLYLSTSWIYSYYWSPKRIFDMGFSSKTNDDTIHAEANTQNPKSGLLFNAERVRKLRRPIISPPTRW